MGADLPTVTLLHHAEYLADVPNKRTLRRHYRVMRPDGPVTLVMDCLNDETGIVDNAGRGLLRRDPAGIPCHGRAEDRPHRQRR